MSTANPFIEPAAAIAAPGGRWAGADTAWQYDLERGLRLKWPGDVTHSMTLPWVWATDPPSSRVGAVHEDKPVLSRVLTYHHAGLPVLGRSDLVPARIEFHERPTYECYGLPWFDYPRVFANPGEKSKHRMPGDDALCLYFPWDPPSQRWRYNNGLVQLLDIVADHLRKELWWRHTGGDNGGQWPGEDADHGTPAQHRGRLTLGGVPL